MEEWKEYKLGDVLTIKYGKDHKQIADGDIPIYGSGGIMRYGERSLYEGPSILIPRKGSLNNIMYSDKPFWTVDTMFWTIINKEVANPLFVYYSICKKDFASLNVGSAVPSLTVPVIEDIEILLPSKTTQDKIVAILKSLDDKIEVNRRINDNLEQQAQALFKSWFVDFEPFKDGEFVESELGMIPKGWRVYSMGELVDIIGGYSYKGNELQISTTAMATIKNFERNGGFKINGFKEIIPSAKAKQEQFLKKFDIIIAHTDITQNADIIGNPALILHLGKYDRIIMSMDLVKVKSKCDYITYGLLYSLFADVRFKGHALGYVNGTTVLHLSKKAIPEYKLALPQELSTLKKYEKAFDLLFAKEAEIIDESCRLAELRDTLLPRLMSGELKVNEIEKSL